MTIDPILGPADQPKFPAAGPMEHAVLAEVTDSEVWTSFRRVPSTWRLMLEHVASATMGYRYGVGHSNGTWAIASALRAQLLERPQGWADGRTDLLVPVMTCTPAFYGAIHGIEAQLHRPPVLRFIDITRDGMMDPAATAAYLDAHADRVLGLMPTTLYGTYPDMEAYVGLATKYGVLLHHDDAQGGAACLPDVPRAPTASVSAHGHAKTTPAGEAGLVVTSDPRLAARLRSLTDCGHGPTELDLIPRAELEPILAPNVRLAEHPAALFLAQWLRGIPQGVQARANRQHLQARLAELGDRAVLWNPPIQGEQPPYYKLHVECTDALEHVLGITPAGLRLALTAWGFIEVEPPFVPAHQERIWAGYTSHGYPGAERYYDRGILLHSRYLRDPRFCSWVDATFDRLYHRTDEIRSWLRARPESEQLLAR